MKKLLTLLSCIILINTAANAQDSSRYAKQKTRVKNMDTARKQELAQKGVTKKNYQALNLSKDQEKQIDNIHANTKKAKEQVKNDNTLTEEQKQEKLKAIDKEAKNKTNSVLTPDQRQKMKQKRKTKNS